MNTKIRRLLAVTVAGALVSAPALAFGGSAQASTAAPAGLLGSVTDTLGSLTGTGTGTTAVPLGILDDLIGAVSEIVPVPGGGSGTADPIGLITDLATGLAGQLAAGDPTGISSGLIAQLSALTSDPSELADLSTLINGLDAAQLQSIADGLLGALPVTDLFGGAIPAPIAAILGQTSTPNPTDTAGLIAALTSFYKAKGETKPDDAATKALPPSVLKALLLALSKKATTPPPATGPSAACVAATKKLKAAQKQLKQAKKKHLKARSKVLAKKVRKARTAKLLAC